MSKGAEITGNSIPRILWVDDQPKFISQLGELLAAAGMAMHIDIATSLQEAEERVERNRYSALVADLCLDEFDRASNSGALLLARLTRKARHLPKFAFSGYLNDPIYRADLDESEIIASEDKEIVFPPEGPGEVQFFKDLYRWAQMSSEVKDVEPETVSYSDYVANPATYSKSIASHWKRHGSWITNELERLGFTWGVVCGTSVVAGSHDIFDFPTESAVRKIGEQHNLVPFAYSLPTPIETIAWGFTSFKNDRFPRIAIKVKLSSWLDDFDTGAMQTHVSSRLVPLSMFDALMDGHHLGIPHKVATKQVELTLVASDGSERTRTMPVAVIEDWDNSGFVKVNSTRQILIGRDVLRAFPVEVTLRARDGKSYVKFV